MGKICALIHFPDSLSCSGEVLGTTTNISVGGQEGLLKFPSLPPNWDEMIEKYKNDKTDISPLNRPLVSPNPSLGWKQQSYQDSFIDTCEDIFFWGQPSTLPSGHSVVNHALIEFDLESDERKIEVGNEVFKSLPLWIKLFNTYFDIVFKQMLGKSERIDRSNSGIFLLRHFDNNGISSETHDIDTRGHILLGGVGCRAVSFKLSIADFESINLTEDSQVYLSLTQRVSHNN